MHQIQLNKIAVRIIFLLALFMGLSMIGFSQKDSTKKITFSAFGEFYYSYDFSKPNDHQKSPFIYNHKRHNEINANLVMAKASFSDQNLRANLALMVGNYAQYNLSNEPNWTQFLYEANLGVKLSKNHQLWLDVGIMPSHIGFESAISGDCWALTRSLLAENSPYYESGLKLSYQTKNEKFIIAGMYLNGWQKIQKPDFIQRPSFGIQATYKPNNRLLVDYSNFIGTDKPDSMHSFRHFHNTYLQYELSKKVSVLAGFDIGSESQNKRHLGIWYAPIFMYKHELGKKSRVAFRAEYYSDRNQIIIPTNTLIGFQTFGFSSNYDYDLNKKIRFRMEMKMLHSKGNIFADNRRDNFSITTNMTIKL